MPECRSFAPIVFPNSKVLILGSMPGHKSLKAHEYYAHPRNRFWQILSILFNETSMPIDYKDKILLLKNHHLALWDTLAYCFRDGSLDSNIKFEHPNAVLELLKKYNNIDVIICNGGKAKAIFKKYFFYNLPPEKNVYYLHSTSPANARMSLDKLLLEWQLLKKYVR